MNFSYEKFLKPLTTSDKNIKIYDNNNVVKYIINPNNVRTLNVQNNLVYIGLESNKSITLDFSTRNEADLSCKKLQEYIDTLKTDNVPYWIHMAVEQEAIKFTKGPTGSTGPIGPQGIQGPQGNQGLSAYDVWLNTQFGTEQDYLNSLIGPIGPTGPMSFGNTDQLEVVGQTINATIEDKDIEIVTKGAGNLLFKIDRDGWLLNYGITNNTTEEIWSSAVTVDEYGNVYFTGGDYTSFFSYVTKLAPNGNVVWQKQINTYSQGESIVYVNDHIYVMFADQSDPASFANISIAKLTTNGHLTKFWVFDLNSIDPAKDPAAPYNVPYGSEIAVDEDDNIYYVGVQDNFNFGFDIIFGKMNTSNSTIEWQKVVDGGISNEQATAIKYRNGFVYVTGTLINSGNSPDVRGDIFVAKYDKDGNKQWAKVIGNSYTYQDGLTITVDSDNYIYIAGYINFDPTIGGPPTGPYNNFYFKLDINGAFVWSKAIDGFNRSIVSIEDNGSDSLFFISTQSTSSTPSRTSTDLILFKVLKSTGAIEWQQYVGTPNRDSVWAIIYYPAFPDPYVFSYGHRAIACDPTGKSVYVAGLTREGGTPVNNAFLMSFDQKSLPETTFGNWSIQSATFSVTPNIFDYIEETTNIFGIEIYDTLQDSSTQTVTLVFPTLAPGLSFSAVNRDDNLTLFSPNTELFVKGIINIDDNYILPRASGDVGQVLTYAEGTNLLEWREQTVKITFNDYETIPFSIFGSASMDGLHIDPINGTASGSFDDTFFTIILPFDVMFMGETYNTVYVGSNSFITFGGGFSAFSGYTEKNPPLPGLFIEAADRSMQKLYTKTNGDQFTIRYEGAVLPSGPATPGNVEISWEITMYSGSGRMDVHIENNDAFGTGFSCLKTSSAVTRTIETAPTSSFRLYKGYGLNNTLANRIYYTNIQGLSYSVLADPEFPGQSLVALDFASAAASAASSFTSFGSTGSLISINSASSYTIHAGVENDADQFIYTEEYFSGTQGLFMQTIIPAMLDDNDRIRIGLMEIGGNWSASVELTHDVPPTGNMIVYDSTGSVITYSQIYTDGDTFSMYVDTQNVYFQINGNTIQTCSFTNPSGRYRFVSKTVVQANSITTYTPQYSSGTLNYAIPDGTDSAITATVSLPPIPSPVEIYVKVNATHTYVGDLKINLKAPSGKIVNLFRLGSDGENFVNTVFSSDNTLPSITSFPPDSTQTGTFSWEGSIGTQFSVGPSYSSNVSTLSGLLDSQPTTGAWVLLIGDLVGDYFGVLHNFSIYLKYNNIGGMLSNDYNFTDFRFYPTGAKGTAGSSGSSGSSGTSGSSGSSGTSGSAGSSGTSGTDGSLEVSFIDRNLIPDTTLIAGRTFPNLILGTSSMTEIPLSGPSFSGSMDDSHYNLSLPFVVEFLGLTYSNVYVGSNSYLTFGAGSTQYSSLTFSTPSIPGIFINSGDRSFQKLYTKTNVDSFVIRYEGSVGTSNSGGIPDPEIEWEITLYNNGVIDINIGTNNAYPSGFSVIKTATQKVHDIDTLPNTGFRTYKGYMPEKIDVSKIYYNKNSGISYSVVPDTENVGSNVLSLDFSAITPDIINPANNRILTATGSSTNTALAQSNLTFDGSTFTVIGTSSHIGHTIFQQTSEVVTTSFGATSATVTYNFESGSVWYHGTADTNYTADFVNIPTTNNRAITATIILSQGVTAYSPTVVKIDGTTQTVKWANGTYSVTPNGVDIVGFTFLRSGSAWTQVLGQISTFS